MRGFSMIAKEMFTLLVLVSLSSETPVSKLGHAGRRQIRRALLDDPGTSVTDRIVLLNEAEDVAPKLFEGDIELTPDDFDLLTSSDNGDGKKRKRNAQRIRQGVWRTRRVPYEIDSVLVNEGYTESIQAAIRDFHSETCIRWEARNGSEKIWVKFVKKKGCWSRVGKQYWNEGFQEIALGSGCNHKGTIMHEMMHAVGFWHEQSRADRDKYVEVMWENIVKGEEGNFNKYKHDSIDHLGANYDYGSIMHYGKIGFSSNGKPTLLAVGDRNRELGQRNGFSKIDIMKLNALYDCRQPVGGWSSWSSFTPCDSACNKYRQRYCTSEITSACPGADHYGIQTDFVTCTKQECNAVLDGHWGRWSSWTSCSATCGLGTHTRTRECNDPKSKNGGKFCTGAGTNKQACDVRSCGLGRDDCDFEADGWCHWIQDQIGPMAWERHTGPTGTSGTGPSGDHTSGSGYYIYVESSAPATTGDKARLLSREFPAKSSRCVRFWYHMYGLGIGQLGVSIKDTATGAMDKVWEMDGDQGNQWKEGSAEISSMANYQVIFEATRGPDFRSDIALDDIKLTDGSCSDKQQTTMAPTTTEPTTLPPTTTEPTTLPPMTAEPTTLPPTTAEPTTLPLTTTEPTTLSPMTAEPTTLPPTTAEPTTMPPMTAEPASLPRTTAVPTTLPSMTTTLPPMTAEPTTLSRTTTEPTTLPSTTTQPSTLAPTSAPIDDFCDFGLTTYTHCDWVNDPTNSRTQDGYNFDWWWMQGPTPSKNTGPSADHTTGSGYYLYLETSRPFQKGNKARLLSTRYPASQAVCLDFWYSMFGQTVGSLSVYVKTEDGLHRVWTLKGNQGNEWYEARVPITSTSAFEIIFEGERGVSYTGDIGIDDVWVKSGSCSAIQDMNAR